MNTSPIRRSRSTESEVIVKINKPNGFLKRGLLICGIVASAAYIAFDVFASTQYAGYSYTSQTISELFSPQAPTRSIEVLFGPVYTVLILAFAFGVWMCSNGLRNLKLMAAALLLFAIVEQVNLNYFPLHMRGTEHLLRDTIHVALTLVSAALMLLSIALGAAGLKRTFRLYSTIAILILLVFAAIAGLDAPRLDNNEPTPFMGIAERVVVYGYMLWLSLFAITMIRMEKTSVIIKQSARSVAKN